MQVYSRSCPSIYRGVVIDNNDPTNLGRCRVRVPSINSENNPTPPWARPIVLSSVGVGRGSVNIPEVGDVVWVIYENFDKEYPLYIGGTYSIKDIPIDINRVILYTEEGNEISYDKKKNQYQINVGNHSIKIDSSGIYLEGNVYINGKILESDDKDSVEEDKEENNG